VERCLGGYEGWAKTNLEELFAKMRKGGIHGWWDWGPLDKNGNLFAKFQEHMNDSNS